MRVTCPACGSRYDLDAAVSDADARRFMDLIAGLHPQVARPLIQYLALFRPEKTGMRWSRMLALAKELEPMIREARITRNGTGYVAPLDAWSETLQYLADRPTGLKLPLKTHGYLLEILAGRAEKVAAKSESERERRRRRGLSDQRRGAMTSVGNLVGEQKKRSGPPPGWADGIRRPRPKQENDDDNATG